MRRGSVLHTCRDCGALRFLSRRDLDCRARPRCLACGGPLEVTLSSGRKKLADAHDASVEQAARAMLRMQ